MADPFWSMFHQALASGSRSTVLKPLGWLIALTLAGAIGAFRLAAPTWFANTLGGLCVLAIVLYFAAYVYFALTDKDSLRSEKYSIQKMAIQKGFIGDDQFGYMPLNSDGGPSLPSPIVDMPKGGEDEQ